MQARCERFVLLPAGQPCEPIPSLQRPVAACALLPSGVSDTCAWLQPCAQTTAVWPRLCRTHRLRGCGAGIALLLGSLWGKTKEGNRIKWRVRKGCCSHSAWGSRCLRRAACEWVWRHIPPHARACDYMITNSPYEPQRARGEVVPAWAQARASPPSPRP